MKTTAQTFRTRTVLAAMVLGTGLVLSACGGADDAQETDPQTQNEELEPDTDPEQEAQSAGEAEGASADDLVAAIEALGYTTQTMEGADLEGLEGQGQDLLGDVEVEPAECAAAQNPTASEQTPELMVIGTPGDPMAEPTVIGSAYDSPETASTLLSETSGLEDTCSEMTITTGDMELGASVELQDVTVAGSDAAVQMETVMDMSGQETTTTVVIAQKGAVVIMATAAQMEGVDSATPEDASSAVEDVVASLS